MRKNLEKWRDFAVFLNGIFYLPTILSNATLLGLLFKMILKYLNGTYIYR